MRRILILIVFSLLFRINAMTMLEVFQNPEQDLNSSFIELWKGNFGDSLEFSNGSDKNLTPEMRAILISRISDTNNDLIAESVPYQEKKIQITLEINHLVLDLNLKEQHLIEHKKGRSLLFLKKSISDESVVIKSAIDTNRKEIYELEKEIEQLKMKISGLKHDLGSIVKFIQFNNLQIRRNKMRISFLGGEIKIKTVEIKPQIPIVASVEETLPLIDPDTLSDYSMAAMEGIELEKCPKHNVELEYSYKMIEDSYKGVKFSYPLYAGWCNISNKAYIFREADDTSKRVVIEIRNKKMKQIDEMQKKS